MGRKIRTVRFLQTHFQAPISELIFLVLSDVVLVREPLVRERGDVGAEERLHLLNIVNLTLLDHFVDVQVPVEHVEGDCLPTLS